jgi:hypothetical protein
MTDQQASLFALDDRRAWQRSSLPDPTTNLTGAAHEHSTDTERAAAALIAPRSGTGRLRVLTIIAESGPLSDWEIAQLLGMRLYTAAPRRGELLRSGWIEDSGERHPTDSGTKAIAWRLSDRGREAWDRMEVGC